jgi:hypothetical protein
LTLKRGVKEEKMAEFLLASTETLVEIVVEKAVPILIERLIEELIKQFLEQINQAKNKTLECQEPVVKKQAHP